jgi:hypothetical protein
MRKLNHVHDTPLKLVLISFCSTTGAPQPNESWTYAGAKRIYNHLDLFKVFLDYVWFL